MSCARCVKHFVPPYLHLGHQFKNTILLPLLVIVVVMLVVLTLTGLKLLAIILEGRSKTENVFFSMRNQKLNWFCLQIGLAFIDYNVNSKFGPIQNPEFWGASLASEWPMRSFRPAIWSMQLGNITMILLAVDTGIGYDDSASSKSRTCITSQRPFLH